MNIIEQAVDSLTKKLGYVITPKTVGHLASLSDGSLVIVNSAEDMCYLVRTAQVRKVEPIIRHTITKL